MNIVQGCDFTVGNSRVYILMQSGLSRVMGDGQERLHSHPNPEIHYIEGGCISFYTENGESKLDDGTLVILPPRLYHSFGAGDRGTRCISFEIKLTRTKDGEETYGEYRKLFSEISHPTFILTPMPELSSVYKTEGILGKEETLCHARAIFMLTFLKLLGFIRGKTAISEKSEQSYSPLPPGDENETVMKILNYINLHYTLPLTLSGAAKEVGLSERQIQRILKENMKEGFHSLLTKKRISTARLLLSSPEEKRPLEEIAYACGFSSYVSFWSNFKTATGMTPAEYKKAASPR